MNEPRRESVANKLRQVARCYPALAILADVAADRIEELERLNRELLDDLRSVEHTAGVAWRDAMRRQGNGEPE